MMGSMGLKETSFTLPWQEVRMHRVKNRHQGLSQGPLRASLACGTALCSATRLVPGQPVLQALRLRPPDEHFPARRPARHAPPVRRPRAAEEVLLKAVRVAGVGLCQAEGGGDDGESARLAATPQRKYVAPRELGLPAPRRSGPRERTASHPTSAACCPWSSTAGGCRPATAPAPAGPIGRRGQSGAFIRFQSLRTSSGPAAGQALGGARGQTGGGAP